MPIAKISASGASNAMKADEGNDSLDTVVRQAIGKESLLSFSRTGDSPVQWIQLLHAFDQQDLPGWPLLAPQKVELQKCDKCSREFCSPINYRRHIRLHRRSSLIDKESHKNRDFLGVFWDKLSWEDAKEVASFEDVSLKEVSGSSVLNAMVISLRKPGIWALPQAYVQAGSILSDIIQGKSHMLQISSHELFSILDDASEGTFLCAGTAESVQKYVIEGEAEKVLELKNVVACASLLFEQRLMKAWVADKEVEALRCQKLLVEEEDAAQKRQAQLKRKKQIKRQQKEQKAREQSNSDEADTSSDSVDEPVSSEISIPPVPSDPISNSADTPAADTGSYLDQIQYSSKENDEDLEAQFDSSNDHVETDSVHHVDSQTELAYGGREFINRWQVPKSHRSGRSGSHDSKKYQSLNPEPVQKQDSQRDRSTLANSGKVWTRKPKVGIDDESSFPKLQKVATNQVDTSICELMIGSIPVQVSTAQLKSDAVPNGTNGEVGKLWKPVSQSEKRGPLPVLRDNSDSEEAVLSEKVEDQTGSSKVCPQSCGADIDDSNSKDCSEGLAQPEALPFSRVTAEAFLSRRWKAAISADHVKLVLSQEPEPPGNPISQNDGSLIAPSPDIQEPSVGGDAENHLAGSGAPVSSTKGNAKGKFRKKPEKGPKQ